jgi:hypothetical protein
MVSYDDRVFINVPFDRHYKKLFEALVFAVHDCGSVARCALETDDGSQVRLEKLYQIIAECRYGIHDLSRTTLDSRNRLPRFNMPLELGIFLGAKRYGNASQRLKSGLILERDQYRYQIYCSDIAGQDIRAHGNSVESAITAVRNWLNGARGGGVAVPGPKKMAKRYLEFRLDLPAMCRDQDLDQSDLSFIDYRTLVIGWLDVNEW